MSWGVYHPCLVITEYIWLGDTFDTEFFYFVLAEEPEAYAGDLATDQLVFVHGRKET